MRAGVLTWAPSNDIWLEKQVESQWDVDASLRRVYFASGEKRMSGRSYLSFSLLVFLSRLLLLLLLLLQRSAERGFRDGERL